MYERELDELLSLHKNDKNCQTKSHGISILLQKENVVQMRPA